MCHISFFALCRRLSHTGVAVAVMGLMTQALDVRSTREPGPLVEHTVELVVPVGFDPIPWTV